MQQWSIVGRHIQVLLVSSSLQRCKICMLRIRMYCFQEMNRIITDPFEKIAWHQMGRTEYRCLSVPMRCLGAVCSKWYSMLQNKSVFAIGKWRPVRICPYKPSIHAHKLADSRTDLLYSKQTTPAILFSVASHKRHKQYIITRVPFAKIKHHHHPFPTDTICTTTSIHVIFYILHYMYKI